MRIAVDCDDVLADSMPVFINYYNQHYNKKFAKSHFFTNLWWDVFNDEKDAVVARYLDFVKSEAFDVVKPIVGAQKALRLLKKNHELIVVTGRPKAILEKTKKWAEYYFPGIFNEIYCTDLHFSSGGGLDKGEICRSKKVDLLIDDYIEFAQECIEHNINVFLMNQPWNRREILPAGVTRVKSWREIANKLT
jgi:uncharacterized HAD superfamily protein